MKLPKLPLLVKVVIAIALGLLFGLFFPEWLTRIFATFNSIFASFLKFCVPLIILGLVAPGIADLGKSAGKLLLATVAIAYGSTLFSGYMTYFSATTIYPMINIGAGATTVEATSLGGSLLAPYFTIAIPPLFDVMTALVLAFMLGLGVSAIKGGRVTMKSFLVDLKGVVELTISKVIIPLLPWHIFGIFLNMSTSGIASNVISIFGKVLIVIVVLHIILLLIQFFTAGGIAKKNPLKALWTMLPAYATALGTASSAATIPVTLRQARKNVVNEDIADFCIPLCATIHLAGSTLKITAITLAICIINGYPFDLSVYSGFILMLGVIMVAAPGVPGGTVMASMGIMQSMLGFTDADIALMIAIDLAIDNVATACNVTGDGAIALVLNKLYNKKG
ncbi:MAG: dicarboxylate/amino acid:cation symporter [Prevotellaceae bacterium]|jgi:Na+/H+-dicarboxylate symporter|nr:dicarboxylate/amino acid:cation symporter [Prevotellaceae bacterium]